MAWGVHRGGVKPTNDDPIDVQSEVCAVSAGNMKESDVLAILREVEAGAKVSAVCQRHAISETTFYRWRAFYAKVDRPNLPQIRQLQIENERLKRMYIELALQNTALNDRLGAIDINPAAMGR